MIIGSRALTFFRGDTNERILLVKKSDDDTLVDLTGCDILLTVDSRENPTDNTTKIFQSSLVPDEDQVVNKGKATFKPTSTDNSVAGKYFYDVQVTDQSGNITTVIKSTYTILQDITK